MSSCGLVTWTSSRSRAARASAEKKADALLVRARGVYGSYAAPTIPTSRSSTMRRRITCTYPVNAGAIAQGQARHLRQAARPRRPKAERRRRRTGSVHARSRSNHRLEPLLVQAGAQWAASCCQHRPSDASSVGDYPAPVQPGSNPDKGWRVVVRTGWTLLALVPYLPSTSAACGLPMSWRTSRNCHPETKVKGSRKRSLFAGADQGAQDVDI